MNYITAFLPWVLWLVGVVCSKYIFRFFRKTFPSVLVAILLTILYISITTFFIIPLFFFKSFTANPGFQWWQQLNKTHTAIIFGFGYEVGNHGEMIPGAANEYLFNWCLKNSVVDTLIVQKAVRLAAEKSISQGTFKKPITLIDMHSEERGAYVNTFEAAEGALTQIAKNKILRVLVLAQPAQLPRVMFDLNHLVAKEGVQKVEFVVPAIASTPYPKQSAQIWTRCDYVYKLTELYYSRPRDAISCLRQ